MQFGKVQKYFKVGQNNTQLSQGYKETRKAWLG